MLIIFDLDDTLIDTSGFVTPFQFKECLRVLQIKDPQKAYQELWKIDQKLGSSKRAITQFFGPDIAEKALSLMHAPLPPHFAVPTTPYAKKILTFLSKSHTLAIVTVGLAAFQLEKLEKAGIDRSIFSKISVLKDPIKKPFYEELIEEFSQSPENVLVCGDRPETDLLPALELGAKTVHMRWGRGKSQPLRDWVHYTISSLNELKRIVEQ